MPDNRPVEVYEAQYGRYERVYRSTTVATCDYLAGTDSCNADSSQAFDGLMPCDTCVVEDCVCELFTLWPGSRTAMNKANELKRGRKRFNFEVRKDRILDTGTLPNG